MRVAVRLFASIQRGSQFLEPGAPTGLTGLLTHSSPRSTLLYLYSSTLERLKQFPESSVYRQSTEALTKHRMGIVESVVPAGLEQWQARVQAKVDEHPDAFRKIPRLSGDGFNIVWKEGTASAMESDEADEFKTLSSAVESRAEFDKLKDGIPRGFSGANQAMPEGPRTDDEKGSSWQAKLSDDEIGRQADLTTVESEPSLTAEQINEIETKIGAGLIEEVIQVAEGERELVDTLAGSKVWEDLEEKPADGQWTYFER